INVVSGRAMPDMTVIVTGAHISAMGGSDSLHPPAHAQVVNATGKFLIPGLWDMHVHAYEKDRLSLFVANGVTGVRQMMGAPVHHEWRPDIESGTLLAPRMILASNIVDGPGGAPNWIIVHNAAEARQAVRNSKDEGADFIKVYSDLSREGFF